MVMRELGGPEVLRPEVLASVLVVPIRAASSSVSTREGSRFTVFGLIMRRQVFRP